MSKTDKKKRAILPIGGLEKTFRRQEIARMFKIVRCPEKLNSFFESLLGNFLYGHFNYFKFLVLAIAFSWERRNVTDLCRYLDAEGQAHRTRFNNFLNVGRWNPESVLREKAMQILSQLKPRRGETIYFVIDDTIWHSFICQGSGLPRPWSYFQNDDRDGGRYTPAPGMFRLCPPDPHRNRKR